VTSIDVSGSVDLDGRLETAVTLHLPETRCSPLTVIVGYPGGGYARGYYDITRLPGYSQAAHHVAAGTVFVACDHLGVGDSSSVDPLELTLERLAAANHATATAVVDGLRDGTLVDGLGPLDVGAVVGIGQSMGGALLVVQQGTHHTFDAVAVLGYGLRLSFPAPDGTRFTFAAPPRDAAPRAAPQASLAEVSAQHARLRYAFHADDEAPELVEADMDALEGGVADAELPPWRARLAPPSATMTMGEGALAPEAAAIDVPVLIGCGERDLLTDPWREPEWYRGSSEVAVSVVAGMAHMHNFARTRARLWERIDRFVAGVAAP